VEGNSKGGLTEEGERQKGMEILVVRIFQFNYYVEQQIWER